MSFSYHYMEESEQDFCLCAKRASKKGSKKQSKGSKKSKK